jgi:hypothetical protein
MMIVLEILGEDISFHLRPSIERIVAAHCAWNTRRDRPFSRTPSTDSVNAWLLHNLTIAVGGLRAAGKALSAAGRQFLPAQRAFRKTDDLLVDLAAVKDIHVVLSQAVNNLLATSNSAEARRVLRDLMKTRRVFRATCRRIERCRGEARMAEIGNDGDPDE